MNLREPLREVSFLETSAQKGCVCPVECCPSVQEPFGVSLGFTQRTAALVGVCGHTQEVYCQTHLDSSDWNTDSPRRGPQRGRVATENQREGNPSVCPAGAQPTPGLWSTSRSRLVWSRPRPDCEFGLETSPLSFNFGLI